MPRTQLLAGAAVAALAVAAAAAMAAQQVTPDADRADISASGPIKSERGPFYGGELVDAGDGQIQLTAINRNPRVTPHQPHDFLSIDATVSAPDGTPYSVQVRKPLVSDPLGRFTTWWGVGFDHWHHGRSGIGSSKLDAVFSEVAVFGVGNLVRDGEVVAAGVPVHVMTMDGDHHDGTLEMDVGDPEVPIAGLPDGHLRVVWASHSGGHDDSSHQAQYLLGLVVLAVLLAFVGVAAIKEPG